MNTQSYRFSYYRRDSSVQCTLRTITDRLDCINPPEYNPATCTFAKPYAVLRQFGN